MVITKPTIMTAVPRFYQNLYNKISSNFSKQRGLKLKDALDLVAKENNHENWKLFKNSLDVFWYDQASPFLTQWFTNYKDAKKFRDEKDAYLLTYKGQYFVVDSNYIEFLGLDPEADLWKKINKDVSSAEALEKVFAYLKTIKPED